MHARVTAILVAHNGAPRLERTLEAIARQTRPVDELVVLEAGSTDDTAAILGTAPATRFLATAEHLPFGGAVAVAVQALDDRRGEDDWLWLLAHDNAPGPDALQRMLATAEVSPSVAVAGPKLVDWDDGSLIRDLGVAVTPLGAAVPLVQDELDQGQHDGRSDVLGVPPGGMLVRRGVWEQLGGFDPALPVVDDGLDFCVRARLAGHRVVVVPAAKVAVAGDGVAGPSRSDTFSARRRLYRARRAAALHRRLVYAPGWALLFHWLSLVPLALARSIGWLLGKQPAAIGGELAAGFAAAFGAGHVPTARRRLRGSKTLGWSAIAPLRVPHAEVRRSRALKREASLVRMRGERRSVGFVSSGGAWVVAAMLVVGVALMVPLLGANTIVGGGLLPLGGSVSGLWSNLGWGWREIGVGFVGAPDPFSAVLAVLGSLTFWQPSFSIVLLWFLALPLAALGAWFCATRITHRAGLRAFFAIAWALAPMLFGALQDGRPAAVLAHLILPWVFFAGYAARRSWAASGGTALLSAALLACAPSLAPALAVVWVIWLAVSGRRIARVIAIPVPALALFTPLIVQQGMRGAWFSLLADPGVPVPGTSAHGWQLALGFPGGTLSGWSSLAAALGMPHLAPAVLMAVLLAPIGILAVLALFLRGTIRATLCLLVAFLGYCTAVAAGQIAVASHGALAVALWPGNGLSLYWLGLTAAATMGLVALGRFAVAPAIAGCAALAVAVAPLAAAAPLGTSAVVAGSSTSLPAYVVAEASGHAGVGTLKMTSQPDGTLAATLVHGTGETLDEQSTLSDTGRTLRPGQKALAELAGNLASVSGLDAKAGLRTLGVSFVLLERGSARSTAQATATESRARVALNGNPALAQVGTTSYGILWAVSGPIAVPAVPDAGWLRPLILIGQGAVILIALLLSIPTGRGERGTLRRPTAAEVAARARVDTSPGRVSARAARKAEQAAAKAKRAAVAGPADTAAAAGGEEPDVAAPDVAEPDVAALDVAGRDVAATPPEPPDAGAADGPVEAAAAGSEPAPEAAADPLDDREWELEETVITRPHADAANGASHDE